MDNRISGGAGIYTQGDQKKILMNETKKKKNKNKNKK